ncbi:vegetative cell wall protein gp1-like [Panicum virgatum]|uniref:vegetative cell wall protein gp1-like n=1 Tax=Panicum virgatum TaxID=38727 RepID=UPI0019D6613D|nr:vegetative cell wall protein gp1-like [Panicum virgatum]
MPAPLSLRTVPEEDASLVGVGEDDNPIWGFSRRPRSASSPPPPRPRDSVADTKSALWPISQPPTASAPSAAAAVANSSPPAPPETSPITAPSDSLVQAPSSSLPPTHTHSATPAPAPAAGKDAEGRKDKDDDGDHKSAPAPAPAAQEIKASSTAHQGDGADDGEVHEEMNGGKKAGMVALAAARPCQPRRHPARPPPRI